jgi:hypothetical protein
MKVGLNQAKAAKVVPGTVKDVAALGDMWFLQEDAVPCRAVPCRLYVVSSNAA